MPCKRGISYDPNNLLDALLEMLKLKSDTALSRALEVTPQVISKIRHHRIAVGAGLLIKMHEVSEMSIKDLRILMGDRRPYFRGDNTALLEGSSSPY